jgi:antitoxin YefM
MSCIVSREVSMSTQTVSISELQQQLFELFEKVRNSSDRLVITQQGQAEAVLLSADDFEGLLETLEILSDTELVQRLIEAEEELTSGGGHSLDEVRERLRSGHSKAVEPR